MSEFWIVVFATWVFVAVAAFAIAVGALLFEEVLPWLFDDEHVFGAPDWRSVMVLVAFITLWPIAIVIACMFFIATENRWYKRRRKSKLTELNPKP